MSVSPERRSRRWPRFSASLGATIILLLLSADYSRRLIQETRSATLYHFGHNSWKAIAPVPGRPVDLGGIFAGDLWLATDAGVFRFDGRQWLSCRNPFNTRQ